MIEISTKRLILRSFAPVDLPEFVAYRSRPEVARYQSWDPAYGLAEAKQFLASQAGLELGAQGRWLQLAVTDQRTGVLYGDCAVCVVADQPATAELGVTLAPAHHGSGFATEALAAVIAVLFDELRLHRVFAHTDDRNRPARELFVRLGFRLEARLVDADWFKGEWTTVCTFAMLRTEWQAGN